MYIKTGKLWLAQPFLKQIKWLMPNIFRPTIPSRNWEVWNLLFHHLIHEVFASKPYFDFGVCSENQGKQVNLGLQAWKESFGASSVSQDFYSVFPKNHHLLNNTLI